MTKRERYRYAEQIYEAMVAALRVAPMSRGLC